MYDSSSWDRCDFSLSPEWRWQRSLTLHTAGTTFEAAIDDDWVRAAREFQAGNVGTAATAAIRDAHAFWIDPDRRRRWELEARLLTDQPFSLIADAMKLAQAAVEAYHAVFFHVRPRLTTLDWITLRAIGGPLLEYIPRDEQPGAVLRHAAYTGGLLACEIVLAVMYDRPLPPGIVTSTGTERDAEEARMRLRTKALITLLTSHDKSQLAEAIRVYEATSQSDSAGEAPHPVSDDLWTLHAEFLQNHVRASDPPKRRPSRSKSSIKKTAGTAKKKAGHQKKANKGSAEE